MLLLSFFSDFGGGDVMPPTYALLLDLRLVWRVASYFLG